MTTCRKGDLPFSLSALIALAISAHPLFSNALGRADASRAADDVVGAPDRITCTAYPTYKDAMDTMAPWTTQTTRPGAGTEQC